MSDTLRLGFIGCGDIAGYMAWFARLNSRLRLAACCDANQAAADSFARKHRIPTSTVDYRHLLALDDVEAVYIATPHDLHDEMIRAAVEAGKHVLVEKPLARTLEEALPLTDHLSESLVKVGVNYQYRYDRGCYALARATQAGALGRILYARANVPWHRTRAYFERSRWHATQKQSGGGTLLTQGSHMLDVLLWALGSPPAAAVGETRKLVFDDVEVEDLAFGIVTLESGAMIEVCSSMIAASEQAVRLEVYGEKGTAVYGDRPWPHVRWRRVKHPRQSSPAPGLHALMRSLEGFRRWIVDGQPYLTPAVEAVPVMAAVDAIYTSARTGTRVPVCLPKNTSVRKADV